MVCVGNDLKAHPVMSWKGANPEDKAMPFPMGTGPLPVPSPLPGCARRVLSLGGCTAAWGWLDAAWGTAWGGLVGLGCAGTRGDGLSDLLLCSAAGALRELRFQGLALTGEKESPGLVLGDLLKCFPGAICVRG